MVLANRFTDPGVGQQGGGQQEFTLEQILNGLRSGAINEDDARNLMIPLFIREGMSENSARLRADAVLSGGTGAGGSEAGTGGDQTGTGTGTGGGQAGGGLPGWLQAALTAAGLPDQVLTGDPLAVDDIISIINEVRARRLNRRQAIRDIAPLTRLGTNDAAESVLDAVVGPDFFTGLGVEPETGAGSTEPLTSLPGVDPAFANLLRQEQRQGAVGAEGLFRQLTEPFTRGLNPLGRQAVESRFDPLFTSFITDPARIEEVRTGRQPTLEEAIRSFGEGEQTIAGPQELLQRLVNIGGMVGTTDPAEETFVAPFLNSRRAETLFTNAATRRLNPFFRQAGRDVLERDIERFRFQNPEDPLIAEIFRRRGRVF